MTALRIEAPQTYFESAVAKKWEEMRPQLDDPGFIEAGYNPAQIEADKRKVVDLEKKFLAGNTTAQISEYLAVQMIEDDMILGENIQAGLVSKYDDYVNGVDFILRIETDKHPVFIAIDIKTIFNNNQQSLAYLNSDRERNFENYLNGRDCRVSYGIDPSTGAYGPIRAPKLILVFDKDFIRQSEVAAWNEKRVFSAEDKKKIKEARAYFRETFIYTLTKETEAMLQKISTAGLPEFAFKKFEKKLRALLVELTKD